MFFKQPPMAGQKLSQQALKRIKKNINIYHDYSLFMCQYPTADTAFLSGIYSKIIFHVPFISDFG